MAEGVFSIMALATLLKVSSLLQIFAISFFIGGVPKNPEL